MKQPIYLPLRDRMALIEAADLLIEAGRELQRAAIVLDGVILDLEVKGRFDALMGTAKSLRRIARDRTNKETPE